MKYIANVAISAILLLFSCNEADIEGLHGKTLAAGFGETELSVYENEIHGAARIVLSGPAVGPMQFRIDVCEEQNIREDVHYVLATRTPVVEDGKDAVEVGWTLTDDNVSNGERSFVLRLVEVPGARLDTARSQVRVRVLDDEGLVTAGFRQALLDCRQDKTVKVPLSVTGSYGEILLEFKVLEGEDVAREGVDFRLPGKSLRLRQGDETALPVEILRDAADGGDLRFVLEITRVTGATLLTESSRCEVTVSAAKEDEA